MNHNIQMNHVIKDTITYTSMLMKIIELGPHLEFILPHNAYDDIIEPINMSIPTYPVMIENDTSKQIYNKTSIQQWFYNSSKIPTTGVDITSNKIILIPCKEIILLLMLSEDKTDHIILRIPFVHIEYMDIFVSAYIDNQYVQKVFVK